MRVEFAGFYELNVKKLKDDSVVRTTKFKNKITDIGLECVGTGWPSVYAYVGTGTTPSRTTDIAMGNWRATASSVAGRTLTRQTTTPYWNQASAVFRFNPGKATGNLTEVGTGWSNVTSAGASNYLWSRELIKDDAGNPITLTILDDEYLEVTYSLRWYPVITDVTGSFELSSVPYTYTARPFDINSWCLSYVTTWGEVGGPSLTKLVGGSPSFSSLPSLTGLTGFTGSTSIVTGRTTANAYVPGSLRRTTTVSITPSEANFTGGITGIEVSNRTSNSFFAFYRWQVILNPPIPKTADNGLTLNLQISWGRYAP